jgi:hypothetical protein
MLMLRGLLREFGLAVASLFASIFVMTFVLFALASIGLVDAENSVISMLLASYILPFSVGMAALVALVQQRWGAGRPAQASVKMILAVGLLFSLLVNYWVPAPVWNLFFLMPGFALWSALSGWLARRRTEMGVGR